MSKGRPRKPTAVLELKGAYKKDPKRKRERLNEPKVDSPIGPYPGDKPGYSQKDAWNLIVSQVPQGVLTSADSQFVWQLARLLNKSWEGDIKAAELQTLFAGMSKLGMNPGDRSRLPSGGDGKPKNPWSDF